MASWQDLTHLTVHPLDLAFRAAVIYFAVLFLLRFSGKRQMGQMGPGEFVVVLLISNAVQNSMNGGDNSLVAGLILSVVLIGMSWLVSVLTYRSVWFRKMFEGTPTLLIHNGTVVQKNLTKERLTLGELRILLRKQGMHSFKDVHSAILEPDGALVVTHESDITNR